MPSIQYGSGAYKRDNGNFPPLTLINCFLEAAKTSENQVALLSREGLDASLDLGSSAVVGIFSKRGCFGGDRFSVTADNKIYRESTLLGTIAGGGPVSIDGSDNEMVVTRGTTAYSYNGTDLAAIAFPDSADVRAVCFINGRFVFVRDGTAKFYWSDILDGRTVDDALSFATAERQPDQLLDVIARGDILWLMGQSTVEAWSNDGSTADLPFSRIEQVVFEVGIKATGCAVKADNTVFFAGSDDVFYRVGEVPTRVSDHDWEEHIGGSTSHRLFTFKRQGHEFIGLRLDDETLLYDCATQQPCEFQSNQGNWIAQCATMQGDTAYFGHSSDGKVLTFGGWDDLGDAMERRLTFAQQVDGPVSVNSIRIWANCGQTELLTGQGSAPTIELRLSDDAGNTWGDWDQDDLGAQGDYRNVPEFRALGMFDFPGIIGEIRVTDPVPFRLSAIKVNDMGGGRSR